MILCNTTIAAVNSDDCHHTAMSFGLQHLHRFKVVQVALLLPQPKYNIAKKKLWNLRYLSLVFLFVGSSLHVIGSSSYQVVSQPQTGMRQL